MADNDIEKLPDTPEARRALEERLTYGEGDLVLDKLPEPEETEETPPGAPKRRNRG